MKDIEIEFKYNANDLSIEKFHKFCQSSDPVSYELISGYDYFYKSQMDKTGFGRHRQGSKDNELTYKRPTSGIDNSVRFENNIQLASTVTKEQIESFWGNLGYTYSGQVFKTCFIYRYSYYTLVYYVCYDHNMNEKGRFFEIEMKEDYNWSSKEEAYASLLVLEKMHKTLGANPDNRVKLSLQEMFCE